jgi:division protein CdvB (Snf7/Vps24/ESCRT-III family)
MQAATSQLKQSSMRQLQQLHTEATEYLQELDDIHAVLQQLVGNCMLLEQPKLAQVR